jgi:sulfite reductase (NADPH) hemoprotein beta-component
MCGVMAPHHTILPGAEQGNDAAIGKVIGPSFYADEIPDVMTNIINTFTQHRLENESFIETYKRLGVMLFKEAVYKNQKNKSENAKKKDQEKDQAGVNA